MEQEMADKRRKFTSAFKARVALDALSERESVVKLCRKHKVHANQIYKWKQLLLEQAGQIFEAGSQPSHDDEREAELLQKIGELTMERDFLSDGRGRSR